MTMMRVTKRGIGRLIEGSFRIEMVGLVWYAGGCILLVLV